MFGSRYGKEQIARDCFPSDFFHNIVDDAERILCTRLPFVDELPEVSLHAIIDQTNCGRFNAAPGYSFLSEGRNEPLVNAWKTGTAVDNIDVNREDIQAFHAALEGTRQLSSHENYLSQANCRSQASTKGSFAFMRT